MEESKSLTGEKIHSGNAMYCCISLSPSGDQDILLWVTQVVVGIDEEKKRESRRIKKLQDVRRNKRKPKNLSQVV